MHVYRKMTKPRFVVARGLRFMFLLKFPFPVPF